MLYELMQTKGDVTRRRLLLLRRLWYGLAWAYIAFVALCAFIINSCGDRWWFATILLFSPRWLLALPLPVFLPLAIYNKRLILPFVVTLLIVVGPIMGFTFHTSNAHSGGQLFRVITCNLQNGKYNTVAFNYLIENSRPDVVALQECPSTEKIKFFEGWSHLHEGDMHIYSRFPLVKSGFRQAFVPLHLWPRTCFLYGTVKTRSGDITFCTVHLPSPRYGLQNVLDSRTVISLERKKMLIDETEYRRQKSQEISAVVALLPSPKIIAGDFNTPVESMIYQNYWRGFQNAYSMSGTGFGWTERLFVQGVPVGVRIDHVLVSDAMKPIACQTGPDVGSDHLPVIADIALLQ